MPVKFSASTETESVKGKETQMKDKLQVGTARLAAILRPAQGDSRPFGYAGRHRAGISRPVSVPPRSTEGQQVAVAVIR